LQGFFHGKSPVTENDARFSSRDSRDLRETPMDGRKMHFSQIPKDGSKEVARKTMF